VTETREIPRDDWNDFFAAFSELHEDEVVDVEVLGTDIGAQLEAHELYLRGISPATSRRDADLALMLDSPDGTHVTHVIAKPIHVWVQSAGGRAEDSAVEIESADGTKTLLRFGSTAKSEDDRPSIERFPRKGDDEGFE
jgi:hypothetical protein